MNKFDIFKGFLEKTLLSVRWVRAQIHSPFRSYAVAKYGKIQPPKK
jgi:hypothetical protein